VVKTGISMQALNSNGSPRANSQVNRLNRAAPGKYAAKVVETRLPGRDAALTAEKEATAKLRIEGHDLRLQKFPK
jgi:hypothetical protein